MWQIISQTIIDRDYFLSPKTFLIDKKFLFEPIGKLFRYPLEIISSS
jgi:hypothetical protein